MVVSYGEKDIFLDINHCVREVSVTLHSVCQLPLGHLPASATTFFP